MHNQPDTLEIVFSYIGLFSSSFTLAIIAWPFISAILTLPILAIMYHRDRRLRWSTGISAYLAVLYAIGLLTFTLYPMPDDPQLFCATHDLAPQLNIFMIIQDAQQGLYGILQLVMNVIFFIPLGYMLCRWAHWRFWIVTLFALSCSIFIETSQLTGFWGVYPCAYRQFDVDDMLTNTTGAMVGFGIATLVNMIWPEHDEEEHGIVTQPGFVHRGVALLIDVLLMEIIVFSVSIACMFAFYQLARPMNDGRFTLSTLVVGTELVEWIPRFIAVVVFLIFEVWIPWTHRGQTLGGMYTQMTAESRPRRGVYRVSFYVARTAVLGTWYVFMVSGQWRFFWLLTAGLLVFWLFVHRMPWDLVPSLSDGDGTNTSGEVSSVESV